MERTLNLPALTELLLRRGLNQSQLADRLKVSREAVSKWFSGESLPQPDKLVRIAKLLGVRLDELMVTPPKPVPVVHFPKKNSRKAKPDHQSMAHERGQLLKRLAPYLPGQRLTQPPTLKDPATDYAYVQRIATEVRREMRMETKPCIKYDDLIGKFSKLHAIILPVRWGAQVGHGNALNVYLPDSATTWVFLNLDSNAVDFNFWMAHELGHSLAPEMGQEIGEAFADAFAQALLFSGKEAEALRPVLQNITDVNLRITRIKREAGKRIISPLTIRLALHAFEAHKGLAKTDLGGLPAFLSSVKDFGQSYKTMSGALFKGQAPGPAEYVATGKKFFRTPFFDALGDFCRKEDDADQYIHRLLGLPLPEAKALSKDLQN